ncbi:MAG: UDP-N-acetylmuramoyl-tripeptide--D-alanyl-D-alanine ligase [Candidatus Adiutrix sp.]|jgi:UDP-N-acetylmuramoyl-tripeptide--D-alanyl-D-alanine ligase|nr:UDP-N-acetylmuramoyl-tripeptide--D-alanyl-D-alanine ligase [Candidatus Adiutrix sp.]
MKDLRLPLSWIADNLGSAERGAELEALGRKRVAGVSTDSRTVRPGEVFVALKGEKFDGHCHAAGALARGALAVVVQRALKGGAAGRALMVEDTLKALGDLALALRRRQELKVLALTGSNGKTGTKEMLAAILRKIDAQLLATAGNFNNLVGLPLTVFGLKKAGRLAVLEMGMNHFGEIARLTEIAEPDVGLVTSIGPAHLEFFGSLSQVAKAKGELFAGLKDSALAVVDADQPLLRRESKRFGGNKLFFGLGAPAQIRLGRVRPRGLTGQDLTLYGPGAEKGRAVRLKLLGAHNAHNALAAAAAALAMGADWDQIAGGLAEVESFPGRLSAVKTRRGLWLLDDSYNANPASMSAGLKVLGDFGGRGARGAILGDMGELGPAGGRFHREIGRLAAELNLDFLALVGPLSRHSARAARRAGLNRNAVAEFESPEEAAAWVLSGQPENAAVLVKGSHYMHMERAVDYLKNA